MKIGNQPKRSPSNLVRLNTSPRRVEGSNPSPPLVAEKRLQTGYFIGVKVRI